MSKNLTTDDADFNIPRYQQSHLLIYGDVMLDRYWYGDTQRISPEAPVPVVRVNDQELRPGGAANVAVNVAALGAQVNLLGCVGQDAEAQDLTQILNDRGVTCCFDAVANHPTITKLRVIGRNQQLIRMDFERGFHRVDHVAQVGTFQEKLAHAGAVILSDYAKGTLENIAALIAMARKAGVPVLVDPKHADFMRYKGATLLTPNLKEFEAMVGVCPDSKTLIEKGRELIAHADLQALLVTRGKDGMMLIPRDADAIEMSAQARQVYDVTGAGDTVIAVLAAGLACGQPMAQAAHFANVAAGIVVGKIGCETVSALELRAALQQQHHHLNVFDEEQLLAVVANAKQQGETIVMTNGCFDILHAGHLQYLEQAKALGDRLIVAVNSDESVRRLKGDLRPFNSLNERMQVLSGLRAVDWVVPFSEETPARLIGRVLPDILVKGGDYQPHEIAGGDAVTANGGCVKVLSFKEGFSTTQLIHKIQSRQELV